ncbi:MAG: hypothetical protein M9963_05485 [Kiritimatiellae bacterium]|nr:hypothetical protein [Kiritimatiellia bacterium]MCO5061440.1 hypothetical protein [Kiritimatiellia bacterium]MCO5067487.1 hypothetical protein [Kiritimatiellia bacterium]
MTNTGSSASLALAGHIFSFSSDGKEPPRLQPAFDPFRVVATTGPATAHYRVLDPDDAPWPTEVEGDTIWQTETWRMLRAGVGDFFLAIHVLPDERPITVARFAPDFSSGDLLRRAGRHGAPTPFAFNYPCDQVAVLNALAPHGVCIVHAGAVSFDGQGLLFCGRSGAGKTTLSRLCRESGATLLNDDRQFLWIENGEARLAPTPWHGLEPEINNQSVPLRAIIHLNQAPANHLVSLCGAAAAARLLGNTVAPFYRADALEHTLALIEQLTRAVPSHVLSFTPTHDAVKLCQSLLV